MSSPSNSLVNDPRIAKILKDPDFIALSPKGKMEFLAEMFPDKFQAQANEVQRPTIAGAAKSEESVVGRQEFAKQPGSLLPRVGRAVIEALPAVGATAGAFTGTPIIGAGIGGGIGEAARQLINRALGVPNQPETSGEAAMEIGKAGATQAAIEGTFRTGGKIVGAIAKRSPFSKVTARKAGELIADEISPVAETPAQFGTRARKVYDTVLAEAGKAKGAVIDNAIAANPTLKGGVAPTNTLRVLDAEISNLNKQLSEGRLSKEQTEKLTSFLNVLQKQRDKFVSRQVTGAKYSPEVPGGQTTSTESVVTADLHDLDELRHDFYKSAWELNPSEARRISKGLANATHEDIVTGLGPQYGKLYESASGRYREIAEVAEETPQFVKIFGRTKGGGKSPRVTPAEVIDQINKDPETAIAMFNKLRKNGANIQISSVQRSILEDMISKGSLPDLPEGVYSAVFGGNAPKIKAFGNLLRESGGEENVAGWISSGIPGVKNMERLGIRFRTPAGAEVRVSGRKLAEIMTDPRAVELITKMWRTPISSPNAAILFRVFANSYPIFEPSDAEATDYNQKFDQKVQQSGIARLEEIAREKGIEIRKSQSRGRTGL